MQISHENFVERYIDFLMIAKTLNKFKNTNVNRRVSNENLHIICDIYQVRNSVYRIRNVFLRNRFCWHILGDNI